MTPPPLATDADPLRCIAQARAAWEKRPDDLTLATEFTQALLNGGQMAQAYESAKRCYAQHPHALLAMEKLALSSIATQRWPVAHSVLLQAQRALIAAGRSLPALLEQLLVDLAPRWWLDLSKGAVTLRRPQASDTPWISALFGKPHFMQRYHRFQKGDEASVAHYMAAAQRAPRETRRLDWIIFNTREATPVGLAALVDIDWPNQRGELLVGIDGEPPPMLAALATAAIIELAFERLNLAKLVSYVYADNPGAQANTLHLGFVQEGLLRSHIAHEPARLDLFINGLTRPDYENSLLLQKLKRRWPSAAGLPKPQSTHLQRLGAIPCH